MSVKVILVNSGVLPTPLLVGLGKRTRVCHPKLVSGSTGDAEINSA